MMNQAPGPWFREEHDMLRDQIRRFVNDEVKPVADAWEADGKIPRSVLKSMGGMGLFGINYPAEYGGSEMDTIATAVYAEELGKSTFGGFAVTSLVHTDMASVHLFNAGSDELKARYMPGIVSGDLITAVGITEPGAGSDVKGIATRATEVPGGYRLNGSKIFITNGVHADLYCIAAKTDTEGRPSQSVTMFLVEKGAEGFHVARELNKLGWRCSDTAELVFEDCFVPHEQVIGAPGKGFYAIMKNFQNERIVLGAMCMGEAQAAIDLTLDYVKTRKAFGASLWQKDAIRQRLGMLSAKVAAGRQLVYQAAWMDAQGMDCVKEVSMVKAFCGELINEVTYDCLQFHGGTGYMMETPINRMYRDARVQSIGGGATEVMLEEVAKRL